MAKDETILQELVEKAQQGDKTAFGQIFEIMLDEVYRYMFFKVSPVDAEDLCEDLFVKVWENLGRYATQKNASFRSWVFTIAHNMVIDYYRKNKTTVALDEIEGLEMEHSDMHVEEETNMSFNSAHLAVAMSKLKEEYRQVITLKYINDFSNEEISTITQKSEGAIRIILHRGLKELQKIFENLYPGRRE